MRPALLLLIDFDDGPIVDDAEDESGALEVFVVARVSPADCCEEAKDAIVLRLRN